jgi:CheY-like chemotaxis protein
MAANPPSGLPRRVLIVDDDELVRESLATVLSGAGFEVGVAADGAEALTLIGRQWYPVIVTDRVMPVIDGIEFVQRLRAVAVAPAYVIMSTGSADAKDYERGYCAGVDLYVSKKGDDAGLVVKVNGGLAAIRKRQGTSSGHPDEPVTIDLESGAHTARHLVGRLHAEIAHATRVKKPLSVLSVCIESAVPQNRGGTAVGSVASEALLRSVYGAVRPKLDWVARLPAGNNAYRLAVIMPAAAAAEVAALETGIRNGFVHDSGPALRNIKLTTGAALLTGEEAPPAALELLGESERRRRGLEPRNQVDLRTVQGGDTEKTDKEEASKDEIAKVA